jgi:hypothetical protein
MVGQLVEAMLDTAGKHPQSFRYLCAAIAERRAGDGRTLKGRRS